LQENSGQPAISRNNGIQIASGRFILPLDADDMIAQGYLNGCRQIIAKRPEVNLIAANCIFAYPEKEAELFRPGLFNAGRLAVKNQIFVASVYAKTLWQKVEGYRENVRGYEDWDMWLSMSMNGAIVAYFDGIGLIYNAKDTGLYHDALKRHEKLYANIILNNRNAYQGNIELVRWAENFVRQNA
jgi:glycosyltransferase involved in cell wall biosynthesis